MNKWKQAFEEPQADKFKAREREAAQHGYWLCRECASMVLFPRSTSGLCPGCAWDLVQQWKDEVHHD